ncbi:MAG TPA: phytanoyl-CoA dioxygenase family protein [Acidimicrobiales bacterium]|nr:phytanoyl-CoA dioxygenase family protein [Acidimicrobiales bacterium]
MNHAIAVPPAERKHFYEENGYLIVPELLAASEVEELRAALAEVLEEAEGLEASNAKFALSAPDPATGQRYVKRVFNPIARHDAFEKLVSHPAILDVLEELIGPNITLHQTKLNLKPPAEDARFEWHQDFPFFPHTNFDLVAVMVFLDDTGESNGCLQVIPGSHKLGPLEHDFSADGQAYGSEVRDKSVFADESRWVSLVVPAGSIGLHHSCMLHSSGANHSDRPRSTLVVEYRATDARQVAGATDPVGRGTQLRGSDDGTVRMVESCFKLPGTVHRIGVNTL